MKLITLSFMTQAITVSASIYDTILPTISPTITQDPWPCTTEVLEKYFDPPKPTGELLTALLHHGDELLKGCTPVGTNAQGVPTCTFPAQSQWCAITIPTTLSSTYSAYGSTASSWWSRYRSEAVDFATYCPGRWYKAMNAMPGGGAWLNDTIAFAGCYEADHPITAATTTTTTTIIIPTPTAVSSSAAASTTSSSSATSTRLPNGITTPEPTQPNIVSDCDNFHLVKGDDTCKGIAQTSGISLTTFSSGILESVDIVLG